MDGSCFQSSMSLSLSLSLPPPSLSSSIYLSGCISLSTPNSNIRNRGIIIDNLEKGISCNVRVFLARKSKSKDSKLRRF